MIKRRKKRASPGRGAYFRHMKAYAQSLCFSNFETTIEHIPNATEHSPSDRQVSIYAMIENKVKWNRVEELRTITLIESGFNSNNKIIARDLLHCAELNNHLRKNNMEVGMGIQFHLMHSIKTIMRHGTSTEKALALCFHDVKSCCNRISHLAASIAIQCMGMPLDLM